MSTSSLNSILSSHPVKSGSVARGQYEVNCNLCGCNGASVRCVKCNSMAFCIGCDDMYHRHPKRRQHLRQAVALEFIQDLEANKNQHQPQQQPKPQQQQYQVRNQNQVQPKTNQPSTNINSKFAPSNETKVLYPWRLTRTISTIRVPDNFWAHPSKMPIPPPRRKKKTLSFAGIKDTFKKLVSSDGHNNHSQQQHQHVPPNNDHIYASIQHSPKQQPSPQNNPLINRNMMNGANPAAYRPLPPTPESDQLYENMRKLSLPNPPLPMKSKEFASTNDLSRLPNIREHRFEQFRGSSLPRKNFSYQDLCLDQEQDFMYQRGMMGSTQSVFPGVCGHQAMPPMASPMCYNMHHCNGHSHCHCMASIQQQRWCNQCMQPMDPYNCNVNSLSNSLEEIGNRHDDDLTDDECDDDLDTGRYLSHSAKNRIRRAKMKRSQSTYTMYGNECFPNSNLNNPVLDNNKMEQNRKLVRQTSPTPSCKSTRSSDRKSSERFRYPNSDISDSSSSSYSKRKSKFKQNSVDEETSDAKIIKPTTNVENESDPEHEEVINDLGQWSCRFCTFLNDSDKNICDICCKTRLKPALKASPIQQTTVEQTNKSRKVSIDTSNLGPPKSTLNKLCEQQTTNQASSTRNLQDNNKTTSDVHEIVFDEDFIREQMQIEKELQRRKENEKRIAEENKKLEEMTSAPPPAATVTSAPENNENKNKVTTEINEEKKLKEENTNQAKTNETEIDQEKIVAKIIEEKINEQFGKLKIANEINNKHLEQQQTKNETITSNVNSTDTTQSVPVNSVAQQPNVNNVNATMQNAAVGAPVGGFMQPQQPQPINTEPSNMIHQMNNMNQCPNVYNQYYPLQHQPNGQLNPITQQWQANNQNANISPSGPFFHQRQLSTGSSNSSVYGAVPINPLPPPNISPYFQQQNDLSRPIMNRNSSFDDLQSMSSVTSASLYYPTDVVYHQQPKPQVGLSGGQIIQILRQAEKKGYSSDDLEVAIQFSPHSPLEWLEENWKNLCESVMTMSNNQILEIERNSGNKSLKFSMITEKDAKAALRLCKGNLWQSVEKCVQRHQENKVFGSDTLKTLKQIPPSKSKSFSMKVTGLGSGRANNDANNYFENDIEDESGLSDYVDAENDADFISEHSKLPMEEFLSSNEPLNNEKDELLNYFLEKIKNSENTRQVDSNELEALIYNWQNEKAMIDYEREQMKLREKEKQKMQKIIDVQKRIGGYLSDGTTTEEELDREVARVFQNKIPELTGLNSERTPTFTNVGDIMEMAGPSGIRIQDQSNQRNGSDLSVKTSEIFSPNNEISVESVIIDQNTTDETATITQEHHNHSDEVFVSPVSQLTLSESDDHSAVVTVIPKQQTKQTTEENANNDEQLNSEPIAQTRISVEVKPAQAQIVTNKCNNFLGLIEPVAHVAPSFTGTPSVIYIPKRIVENVITESNQFISGSQVENITSLQPMFTGNFMVKQVANKNVASERPPKQSTSKDSLAMARSSSLVKQSSFDSNHNEDRSRLNTKLSYTNKSLSLTELSSSVGGADSEYSVPQKPVYSKLRGIDKLQKAHLMNSENDLPNKIRFNPQTSGHLQRNIPSFKLHKSESIESYLHDRPPFDQLRKERARCLIVNKLKSFESVNSSNSLSAESTSSVNTTAAGADHFGQMADKVHLSPTPKLESVNQSVESIESVDYETNNKSISKSIEEYSYDFQWARTELECELCASTIPVQDIVVMITCTHYACRECMKRYLTIQIRERQRLVITCPFCDQPDISADQDEQVFEYLAIFDPFVRHIIEPDVYELYQRKVRDRALMRDPNFLWCIQCSSGFIIPNPKALTVICPDCRCVFCRTCKKKWKKQHLNITCEEFSEWEKLNDMDYLEQQLNKHLKEFGIECPNCHFRYQLAKGGCMHFRCTQCSYDFCGGCSRPFKLGSRCFRAKVCERLGLHAHHPRNCLFYLRDKDIADLQKLLDQNNIQYKTTVDETGDNAGKTANTRCQVMEQKEVDFVMKDKPCNRYVEMAGLCKLHYKEYLGNLIYQNNLDPIHIFTESELELTLKRENIRIPSKIRGEDYIGKLKELILEKIPLDLK